MKLLNLTVALLGFLPYLSAAIPVADPEADLEMHLEKRKRRAQTCKIVNVDKGHTVNCRYEPTMEAGDIFGFPGGEKFTFSCYKKGDCVHGVCTWDQVTYLKTTCYVNGYYTDNHCTSRRSDRLGLLDPGRERKRDGKAADKDGRSHFPLYSSHFNPGSQMMKFQFVENGTTDPATRKLIRSHVMKGKNVGKVRARPTQKRGSTIESTTGGDKLFYQFESIGSDKVYPGEFCVPSNLTRSAIFQNLVSDEAFFYGMLAMAEICGDSLIGRTDTSPRALIHLSHTYRCIGRNLENGSLPSDSTIAAVMFMAVYDDLTGQPERSKIHVEALYRMVELRGGLDQLKANRLILQKVCRVDIRYAIFAGVHPRFARDEFPHKVVHRICSQSTYGENAFSLPNGVHVYDPYLRNILIDFMRASRCMNGETAIAGLDPCQYNDVVISVCYRLLCRYPLAGNGPESDNDEAYYLGILGLVIPLLFRRFRFQPVHYDLLMVKLRGTIEKATCNYNKQIEETTLLWLLFASGISILDPAHWIWLIPRIKSLLATLKLDSWENAREEIKQLPWINAAHDKLGEDLWQAVAKTGPSE
ncbi:hypothetical protein FQN50_001974 [Emmonsiellopsis sp. PD_5]|nr:hypothetical protein FQN50_001974 [Emmonsiellopsis sp. PD_5]